mgnify:CR=1 FL=1
MSDCAKRRLARSSGLFWRYFLEGMSLPDFYSYRPLRRGSRLSPGLVNDLEAVGRDFRAAMKFELDDPDALPAASRRAVKADA